jgi:hypothetical protein
VGATYSFIPTATDADGDALTFSIQNKPAWAAFNTTTGQLSGTPAGADTGVYADILIQVSDGSSTTALPPFTLSVIAVTGSATLSWTVPTQNTDGSALTNLAGYWIYHGIRADNLTRLQQISDPAITKYIATGLTSGTHYFTVTAFNSSNTESAFSAVGSTTVP